MGKVCPPRRWPTGSRNRTSPRGCCCHVWCRNFRSFWAPGRPVCRNRRVGCNTPPGLSLRKVWDRQNARPQTKKGATSMKKVITTAAAVLTCLALTGAAQAGPGGKGGSGGGGGGGPKPSGGGMGGGFKPTQSGGGIKVHTGGGFKPTSNPS